MVNFYVKAIKVNPKSFPSGQINVHTIVYIPFRNVLQLNNHVSLINTVGSKINGALAILLANFLSFDCQFLSSHACYKQYKA